MKKTGTIIILNGTPRSGKSSIAKFIQDNFKGVWMNLGVDHLMKMTPDAYQPGIGLRPGGERPDLEPVIERLYIAMYESIASFSRAGINVVVDVGHHDGYSTSLDILKKCAMILEGYPAYLIGVHCPIEIIMKRRLTTWNIGYTPDGNIPKPVKLWQKLVHEPGIYDLEVDTSILSSAECANLIRKRIKLGPMPTSFEEIRNL
ncbi:chloramphenicol phosphotransferase CPT family protein [Metabacillus halosaccharovorans]|uniref:Chloramphenicol phosphotransferase n=1 Tax=Metabacillus halosaccharovorans TaxID=930124 RepID=A0ABT3DEW6_9BACI|nr:chloramphenicol phosphotransferase [Metabacillus halosaccharovorans]MCV9885620.1 chloramphenicol phosphotransferase [Metabacillus halosaccharovorans]